MAVTCDGCAAAPTEGCLSSLSPGCRPGVADPRPLLPEQLVPDTGPLLVRSAGSAGRLPSTPASPAAGKFRRLFQMGADSYLPDFSGSNVVRRCLAPRTSLGTSWLSLGLRVCIQALMLPTPAKAEAGAFWAPWRSSTGLCGQTRAGQAKRGS